MKKIFSIWSILAMLSFAVAIDFYIAIHENANPTGEQLLVAYFIIVYFAIFAFVCVGAHIEKINAKK